MSQDPTHAPQPPVAPQSQDGAPPSPTPAAQTPQEASKNLPPEIGGPKGPEPTRFGDWEQKGRATDF